MPTIKVYMSNETVNEINNMVLKTIEVYSKEYNIEEALIRAIIKQESDGYIFAYRIDYNILCDKSWYNKILNPYEKLTKEHYASYGLMQVLYGVAKNQGFEGNAFDLFHPQNNIMYGCILLKELMKKYSNIKDVISAYNQGSAKKNEKGKYLNQDYVDNVYKWYKQYGGRM